MVFRRGFFILVLALTLVAGLVEANPAAAQAGLTPEVVTLEAEDGLALVGHYYAPLEGEEDAPAVLLMHHAGSRKESWTDFVPTLHEAGYAALAIDIRGYGESGSETDWVLAEADTQQWLTWLSEQEGVDSERLNIVGSSIGGDLGLRVMAIDERIRSIAVLSPGLDFQGVMTAEAVEQIDSRPIFLATGNGDEAGMAAVQEFIFLTEHEVQIRIFDTSACCSFLFMTESDLAPSLVLWLDTFNR
jgi:cephalosporin-C deacetylase-like acetyl esterase